MRLLQAVLGAAVLAAPIVIAATGPAHAVKMDEAVLQGLDKITARISTIKVPVGQTVNFGSLQITVKACDKRPPEETPESAAFIQVVEQKPGETQAVARFSGWMFASSPALSAMEHPVYDLWVLDCDNQDGTPAEETPALDNEPADEPAPEGGAAPAD